MCADRKTQLWHRLCEITSAPQLSTRTASPIPLCFIAKVDKVSTIALMVRAIYQVCGGGVYVLIFCSYYYKKPASCLLVSGCNGNEARVPLPRLKLADSLLLQWDASVRDAFSCTNSKKSSLNKEGFAAIHNKTADSCRTGACSLASQSVVVEST